LTLPNHHCRAVGEYRHRLLHWNSEPKKGVSQTDGGSNTGPCSGSFRSKRTGCHSSLVPCRPIKFHQSVRKCESKGCYRLPVPLLYASRDRCRCEYLCRARAESVEVRPHVSIHTKDSRRDLPMRVPQQCCTPCCPGRVADVMARGAQRCAEVQRKCVSIQCSRILMVYGLILGAAGPCSPLDRSVDSTVLSSRVDSGLEYGRDLLI